jgi:hypothetical protein
MEPDSKAVVNDTAKEKGRKKPYSKPACVSEEIFETTALACAKRAGQGGVCNASPRSS